MQKAKTKTKKTKTLQNLLTFDSVNFNRSNLLQCASALCSKVTFDLIKITESIGHSVMGDDVLTTAYTIQWCHYSGIGIGVIQFIHYNAFKYMGKTIKFHLLATVSFPC